MISNSLDSGNVLATSAIRKTVAINASTSAGADPRAPAKSGARRVSVIIWRTVDSSTGNKRIDTSEIISVRIPPTPIVKTFPSADEVTPTSASTPFGIKVSTRTSFFIPLPESCESEINVACAVSALISRATAPASLLCSNPGTTAFKTARPPTNLIAA